MACVPPTQPDNQSNKINQITAADSVRVAVLSVLPAPASDRLVHAHRVLAVLPIPGSSASSTWETPNLALSPKSASSLYTYTTQRTHSIS